MPIAAIALVVVIALIVTGWHYIVLALLLITGTCCLVMGCGFVSARNNLAQCEAAALEIEQAHQHQQSALRQKQSAPQEYKSVAAPESQPIKDKPMFCGKCAAQIADGDAFCRACGAAASPYPVSASQKPAPSAQATQVEFDLGKVLSPIGRMDGKFVLMPDGNAYVHLICIDPTNLRKAGVFFRMDSDGFSQLQDMLTRAEEVIQQMRDAGRLRQ